jgi:hypothetical protein
VLEEEDAVVFGGQVLQLVPLAGLEALQALVLPVLLPQMLLRCVLDFVLELQLVLPAHLHLYAFGTLLSLLAFGCVLPIGLGFVFLLVLIVHLLVLLLLL